MSTHVGIDHRAFNMIEAFALEALHEHGLFQQGWRFAWDDAKNRAGVCKYGPRRIGMSRHYAAGWLAEGERGQDEIIDTVLHEVAHAIAGHAAGHGPEWKRVARSIGCNAERLAEPAPNQKQGRYEFKCKGCGHTLAWRWRLTGAMREYLRGATGTHNRCGGDIFCIDHGS